MSEGLFEKASRLKVRFITQVGNISTEDLWDVPLINSNGLSLDNVAKTLNKALKDSDDESFVKKTSTVNILLELKFAIVKHVIEIKLAAAERQKNATLLKAKKEQILGIIATKENEELHGESVSKLKEMLDDLTVSSE